MKNWPLSAKLTAWSVLTVGLAVLACAVGTGSYLRHEQIQLLEGQLKRESRYFFEGWKARENQSITERVANIDQMLPLSSGKRYIEVLDDQRSVLYRSPKLGNTKLPFIQRNFATINLHGKPYRLAAYRRDGLEFRIAADQEEIESDAVERALAVLPALPVLIGLTALGGWWIARKALAPVNEMAEAAEAITAERLDSRLPVPGVRDEIGRLTNVLNAMFDRLDKSFRQAMRFSADASHELKTPLTILRSGIEDLLESPKLSETDRTAVAGLLEQTHRLSSITESLLLLSRADAGRLTLDLARVDLCEVIEACVEDARILAEARQIQIAAHLPKSLAVQVDVGRVSQVVLNLLHNAVKYNVEAGTVEIVAGVDEAKERIWIRIGNTGPGISIDSALHLFERFYRDHSAPNTSGHGLGLSIARELARAHGGDVMLVRSGDGWTEFEITLRLIKN